MIVDDNDRNRLLLEAFFDDLGQQYVSCASGEEAIALCDKQNIALILMDIKMPGLNGVQTMQIIRKKYKMPILAVTAYGVENSKEQYLRDGFSGYISKPIDLQELKIEISLIL